MKYQTEQKTKQSHHSASFFRSFLSLLQQRAPTLRQVLMRSAGRCWAWIQTINCSLSALNSPVTSRVWTFCYTSLLSSWSGCAEQPGIRTWAARWGELFFLGVDYIGGKAPSRAGASPAAEQTSCWSCHRVPDLEAGAKAIPRSPGLF